MARIDYAKTSPQLMQKLLGFYLPIAKHVEKNLLDMVYLRISQINGCSYCVDQHWQDAKNHGQDLRKLNSVVTWKKTNFFSEKERAALLLAEKLTELKDRELSDEIYEQVKAQFSEKELVDLTMAISCMNAMNRLAIAFKKFPS